MKKQNAIKTALIVSGALTAIICCVMNFCLIPIIESSTEGIRMFDMNSFGYSFETAKKFVSLLSAEGLDTYLHKQLPLDFIYPAVYLVFFSLAIIKLKGKKFLVTFPFTLAVCDYAENIMTEIMLRTDFSEKTAHVASIITVCKSVLMYAVFIIIIALVILRAVRENRKRAEEENSASL